jgi:DNA modification methylase
VDTNLLYYGDNLDVLRRHVKDESVDLVYLDPPFNSNASYNVLFTEHGAKSPAQINAFEDTWRWDEAAALDYEQTVEQGGKVAQALHAFHTLLGTSDMLAYLSMMAPRLVELQRVMKPTASIYLHCDPTASHYLKLLMDSVFGPANFRNEIVWKRTSGHSDAGRFGGVHDSLLYYSRGARSTWHKVYQKYDDAYVAQYYRYTDADGRRFMSDNLSAAGLTGGGYEYEWRGVRRLWRCPIDRMKHLDEERRIFYTRNGIPRLKRFLDEAKGLAGQDVWDDVEPLRSWHAERLGYPTQKPEALLDRILQASSDEDDVVLDPFCGCGTTISSAQGLGRHWIGIDITHLAIGLIKHRLADTYGPGIASTYQVIGEPTDEDGARELAETDPFQFQAWALGLVGARIASSAKKGGDKGIDGRLYFHDGGKAGDTKQIVFSVKAGHLLPTYLRDLRGVIEREEAHIGVLLSFETPSGGMRAEAASAGFYRSPWGSSHPRLQLLTVGQILEGRQIDYPHLTGGAATFRRAQRARPRSEQGALDLVAEEPDPGYGETPDLN